MAWSASAKGAEKGHKPLEQLLKAGEQIREDIYRESHGEGLRASPMAVARRRPLAYTASNPTERDSVTVPLATDSST